MTNLLDFASAFARYEAVKERFPSMQMEAGLRTVRRVEDLSKLMQNYDVFVFDAFGVLNVGETAIKGAVERISALRAAGKRLFVLSNAASYGFLQLAEKFDRLGFEFSATELISSRMVCETHLAAFDPAFVWGVVAPSGFSADDLPVQTLVLEEEPAVYDRVDAVLFLSSQLWNGDRQLMLRDSLAARARPVVIANPDLVAPREDGLSVEPGLYGHDLLDHVPGLDVTFHGKPFPSVYEYVEDLLDGQVALHRIAMVGDSPHTDILGARARGWGSVLVTDHGFPKGQDVAAMIAETGIEPDWIVPSI